MTIKQELVWLKASLDWYFKLEDYEHYKVDNMIRLLIRAYGITTAVI